jgi:glycosyltransferase involved in cell wall biosynthesis
MVPSLFPETFGMVAAEAMSLGTPVIAHNRGALPELIKATSGGLIYDHESELTDQMRRLAIDDHLFASLSEAATARIPSIWCEEAHTKAYLENAAMVSGEATPI